MPLATMYKSQAWLPAMLRLAIRNLFRHKGRTLVSFVAVAFGVTILILSGGFVQDFLLQMREATIHSQYGHLQIYKAGYSEEGRRSPYRYMLDNPQEIVDRVAVLSSDISDLLLRMDVAGLLNNGRTDIPIFAQGVQPAKEALLGSFMTIIAGRELAEEDVYGTTIGEGVAEALKLAPGDYVTLLVTTPEGALNSFEFEVIGVFQSFSQEYDAHVVRIPLAAAQTLLDTSSVHSLVVSLHATEATDRTAQRVQQALGPGFEVKTWYELADFYQKTVDLYRQQFGVLQVIILAMILLSVTNSVNMTLHERTGEFGTLMALGNSRRRVFGLILMETTLLGIVGAVLGVVVGVFLALAVSAIGIPMPPPPNSNSGYTALIRVVPAVIGISFLIGAWAAVLAAILPARRAILLPITDALRHNV